MLLNFLAPVAGFAEGDASADSSARRHGVEASGHTAATELELQDVNELEVGDGKVLVDVYHVGTCGSEFEGFASQSPVRVPPLLAGHEFSDTRVVAGQPVAIDPLISYLDCDSSRRDEANRCRNRVTTPRRAAEGVTV